MKTITSKAEGAYYTTNKIRAQVRGLTNIKKCATIINIVEKVLTFGEN